MYAVVKIKGHQYKVAQGDSITVDRVDGKEGQKLEFPALLVADGEKVDLGADASKKLISTHIVEHKRGKKVNTLRFKAKTGYRRRVGFRAEQTVLQVDSIGLKAAKKETPKATSKTAKTAAKKKSTK